MTEKVKLFLGVLIYVIIIAILILVVAGDRNAKYKRGVSAVFDKAVIQAQLLYEQKKQVGTDLSSGPCLTNDLFTDWVVDIVHNPRQPKDDLVQNQCPAFTEGRANHFVELDMDGNVVRVK